MKLINITKENIAYEHICCMMSDAKGENSVESKKNWLTNRFDDGLVFLRGEERGKIFIEYIPAEKAWFPIEAEGYMHINCLWVSGKFKGTGLGGLLLQSCIDDAKAKGKKGLTVISSKKKMAFLSDPKFLKYKGFITADTAFNGIELMYLPFESDAPIPKFKDCARSGKIEQKGYVLYYTNQCPFTAKYVPVIEKIAAEKSVELIVHKLETVDEAQNCPSPCTTYSLFVDGEFYTNEIQSDKKFEELITK